MTRNGNCPWFRRMMVLSMAAFCSGQSPALAFQTLDHVAHFHCSCLRSLHWREEVIVRSVVALGFRVFVGLVANVVIAGLAAVRVDALNHGHLR